MRALRGLRGCRLYPRMHQRAWGSRLRLDRTRDEARLYASPNTSTCATSMSGGCGAVGWVPSSSGVVRQSRPVGRFGAQVVTQSVHPVLLVGSCLSSGGAGEGKDRVADSGVRRASRVQDAVRLLFLLDRCGAPCGSDQAEEERQGAVAVVRGQKRLQALDFGCVIPTTWPMSCSTRSKQGNSMTPPGRWSEPMPF